MGIYNNKFKVGDKVRVKLGLSTKFSNATSDMCARGGRVYTVSKLAGDWYTLEGSEWLWGDDMLESVTMTKEDWIKELLDGKVGIQSGNTNRRYTYANGMFRYTDISGSNGLVDINNVLPSAVFSIEEECELTIQEIEKRLGITNLKIVK